MNIEKVLNKHNLEVKKAQENFDNLLLNINKETAKNLEEVPLSDFENLTLDRLYKILNGAYWYSEKRVNEVIDIIERKKLETRKREGFVLYTELNSKINLSNELKMKIEDRLNEAFKSNSYINKEFLLEIKLDDEEDKNKEIWYDVISKLIETNNANVIYSIKCIDEDCSHPIVKFKGRTIMWAKIILDSFDKYKETGEAKYEYKAYEELNHFIDMSDNFSCLECDTDFSIDDIYDELKNITENSSIYMYEPSNFKNKEFYPINKNKIKIIK